MEETLDPRGLANVNEVVERFISERKIAGASVYIARGDSLYRREFGYMDIENKKPVMPDTIYRVASMTKPTTMVGLMKLYERGLFRLSDPVYAYIPDFKEQKVAVSEPDGSVHYETPKTPVTIRNLMTMTSGMPYGEKRPRQGDGCFTGNGGFSCLR